MALKQLGTSVLTQILPVRELEISRTETEDHHWSIIWIISYTFNEKDVLLGEKGAECGLGFFLGNMTFLDLSVRHE